MKAVPYFQCAICHELIRWKGPSLIILHDDEGKKFRADGLCQDCYSELYHALARRARRGFKTMGDLSY